MKDKDHPQTGENVSITVNGAIKQIHRGHQAVVEIKTVGGVPISDELAQVINGVITPLPDNGAVTIKGGEVFIGHPRDSSSA